MSAVPYDTQEQDWDNTQQEAFGTPGRPRRRFLNRKSAALAAVITCAAGFYAGIRVEKGQLGSNASAATTSAAGGAAIGARTGASAGASTATGAGGGSGFPGAGRFGAGGNATLGTISSVNGNTIYLTDSTGNTVKVTLSPTTKLTKSLGVSKSSLHPGDAVVIQGVKDSKGTVSATSVSDSGARPAASGSSSSSGSSGGGSASGG